MAKYMENNIENSDLQFNLYFMFHFNSSVAIDNV